MRTILRILFIVSFAIFNFFAFSQNTGQGWTVEYKKTKAFVPNLGQFELPASYAGVSNVKFACDASEVYYYFTPTGVSYELTNKQKVEKSDAEKQARAERRTQPFNSLKEWQDFEHEGNRIDFQRDVLHTEWIGANPDVELIVEDQNNAYHNYTFYDENRNVLSVDHVPSYNKLIYKNIYPNIDVVYEFHPQGGIKYSVHVHPGGDISQIRLKYSKEISLLPDGTIHTPTRFGDIIDQTPLTFYEGNEQQIISSQYTIQGNEIAFELENFDATKTIIIDPWTVLPTFATNWDCVWECEQDPAGNVYIIGGVMPLQLIKYNSAGVQQWVYNTPYDTTAWLGTFATDDLGDSYITNGSTAMIQKVSTAGTLIWNNSSPGGLFMSTEFWNIEFNCDQTELVIGGTGGSLPPLPYIYNINMATGNVINSVQVCESTIAGIPPNTQEVRSIIGTENEKYYFITQDTIGYVNQGLTLCPGASEPFHINNGIDMGYKCENWRYNNTGMEALAYYDGFVYVHRGNQIQKRDFATAAIVATANIPGGAFSSVFLGGNTLENCGIDIDDCGNVYVGSKSQVVKYDANLVQLATYPVAFNVYDVHVNVGGEIIAAGSTGNSGSASRTGSIQSINAGACVPLSMVCCNPFVCTPEPLCTTDPAITLTPDTPGGTWSGPAGLNTTTGVFNPAISGPGTFTVTYTLLCGDYDFTITVTSCSAMSVCEETDGTFTVSGGTPDYSWATEQSVSVGCVPGLGSCAGLFSFTDPAPPTLQWVSFATGTNVTIPGSPTQVQITDGMGVIYTFDPNTVGPCSTTCDPTISPAGPFCQTDAAINLTAAETGGTWSGTGITNTTNGTFNPATAGPGSHTITYTGTCGLTDTETIVVNATTTPTFNPVAAICSGDPLSPLPTTSTNGINGTWSPALNNTATTTYTFTPTPGQCATTTTLTITVNPAEDASFNYSAGSYCPTDSDPSPTITGTSGGTFTISGTGVINPSTGLIDLSASGLGSFTITYTTPGTCNDVSTFNISITSSADATITPAGPFCEGDTPINLSAADVGGTWSGTGITDAVNGTFDPSVAGAGTHTITYTIGGSCGATDTENITVNANDDASFNYTSASFCLTDPNPSATISGTAGGNFTISGSGVINPSTGEIDIASSGAGTYTVTYTTTGACPTSSTFNITLTSGADATITAAGPFCEDAPSTNLVAADPGGTWSGTGITDATNGTFDPATAGAGSHTITYTISGGCGDTDTETIIVNTTEDASFNYSSAFFCTSDPNPTAVISGTPGGTFTISSTGVINASTGQVDIASSGVGTFTVTYTTTGACPSSSTFDITISAGGDATILAAGPFCLSDSPVNLTAVDAGGTWSGTGITNAATGTFDPSVAGVGTHTITYTLPGSCGAVDTENITVNAASDASFNFSSTTFCLSDTDPTPIITGTSGGSFTISGTGVINATTGLVDLSASGVGTFTITYNTGGACAASSTVNITITNSVNTTINPAGPFCSGDPSTTLTAATAGGTWSGTGITDATNGVFNPTVAGPGTHTITYTVAGACGGSSTINITVNASESAVINYSSSSLCENDTDPFPSIMGTIGGTFTIDNGGVINPVTGIIDVSASGPGTYTVTYTTSGICFDVSTFVITINASPMATILDAGPFCIGTGDVSLVSSPSGGTWEGNGIIDENTGLFNTDSAGIGTHEIIYTIGGSCPDDDTIYIVVGGQPTAWVSNDTLIFIGDEITLEADGGESYFWYPDQDISCTNCQFPDVNPLSATNYCVIVTDSIGCSDTACVVVNVDQNCGEVFIPNAFSPDGLGDNNLECVYGRCIVEMYFVIYDRWGEKVFESSSQNVCWDGTYRDKPMNTGVYVYTFEGTLITGEKIEKKGNITLVR